MQIYIFTKKFTKGGNLRKQIFEICQKNLKLPCFAEEAKTRATEELI
jgi:hypothetical protein